MFREEFTAYDNDMVIISICLEVCDGMHPTGRGAYAIGIIIYYIFIY